MLDILPWHKEEQRNPRQKKKSIIGSVKLYGKLQEAVMRQNNGAAVGSVEWRVGKHAESTAEAGRIGRLPCKPG